MKKYLVTGTLLMLTVVGAIICAETSHTKMMQRFAFHGSDLLGLKQSAQRTKQNAWLNDLKELRNYVQTTQPRTLSATNKKTFNKALDDLTDHSFKLFNTAQLVYNMKKPNLDLLEQHNNMLTTQLKTLKAFKKKLTAKFSDYKTTKAIKHTLVTIFTALEGIYERAINDLKKLRATAQRAKNTRTSD